MDLDIAITPKQQQFINSTTDETLFGGAAGGGKSMRPADRCVIVCAKVS